MSHDGSHYARRTTKAESWVAVCPPCGMRVVRRTADEADDVLERHRLGMPIKRQAVW